MISFHEKNSQDVQLKIKKLRAGRGYLRKILLGACGITLTSLFIFITVVAGQAPIYTLLDKNQQNITADFGNILITGFYFIGIVIPAIYGFNVVSSVTVFVLVLLGAFIGFFLPL